jgi:RNA polymerase sigma factor (sigma-70 family)
VEASALSPPAGRLARRSLVGPLLRLRSDEQLVALFRAGHDDAFQVIHDRYRQRLFAYARQMLAGSRTDAEDALQDVFLRAYHALRVDDRPVTLRAWLYRVAHNRCIDQLRRPVPAPADVFDMGRAPLRDPLEEAERREDLRRLIEDVRRLPAQQRSALLMRELEGLSYAELSDALHVSIPAIKSLLVRARIGLVEAIEARDTACTEIRTELAEALDRGVRASGRSRRHLRECAGCREYRTALQGVGQQLHGLVPGGGPLATIAKLLGLGGAGSGAAAGGSAAAGGAAAGGGASAVLGTGAVSATASKVVAVVAAAAVVGGGAAEVTTTVDRHAQKPKHAAPARASHVVAPALRAAVPVGPAQRHRAGLATVPAAAAHRARDAKPADAAKRDLAALDPAAPGSGDPTTGGTLHDRSPVESASGGVQAPDEIDSSTTGVAPGEQPAGGTTPGTTSSGGTGAGTGVTIPPGTGASTGSSATPGTTAAQASGPSGQPTGSETPTAQGASATDEAPAGGAAVDGDG